MTNESDRELLELAAKAVGYTVTWDGRFAWRNANTKTPSIWNSLEARDDALLLAVDLRMEVHITDYGSAARIGGEENVWYGYEAHKYGGHEAATMRAITRAAAEVGRRMK